MANLACITKELLRENSSLSSFRKYEGKLSREDVATLVETFEFALKETTSEYISSVWKNNKGYFAFMKVPEKDGTFDFYGYLNEHYEGDVEITPLNAKFMYSQALSRGIYSWYPNDSEDILESNRSSDDVDEDDEEVPTGFMDVDEIESPVRFFLVQVSTGDRFEFGSPSKRVGRSSKTAEYVIRSNINISRPHAEIWLRNNKPFIKDLGSANGTYVEGNKLESGVNTELKKGSKVMLADEAFMVESDH